MFADALFIAILVAFFGLCVGFVHLCDRVIGVDEAPLVDIDTSEDRLAA